MEKLVLLIFIHVITFTHAITTAESEGTSISRGNTSRHRFTFKRAYDTDEFSSLIATLGERNAPPKAAQSPSASAKKSTNSSSTPRYSIKRSDDENLERSSSAYKPPMKLDTYWIKAPFENFTTARKDSIKKHDHSMPWPPTWSSKKEIYHNNNRNKKNRKYLDSLEDYLGLDSKYHHHHDSADRKYIHEHEGFFFPIHVPASHHEKDDHLIPLLLLLLLPLLLFAIIIPLNANLLSTLFLIMQNNGATTTAAAQLAAATGRRKRRDLHPAPHPIVEERIMEVLHKISSITDF